MTQRVVKINGSSEASSRQVLDPVERLFLDAIRAGLDGDAGRMQQALRKSLTRSQRLLGEGKEELQNALLVAAASAVPPVPGTQGLPSRELVGGWRAPQRVEGFRFPDPSSSTMPSAADRAGAPAPAVDLDRLPAELEIDNRAALEPVLPIEIEDALRAIVQEHTSDRLEKYGLAPTRTVLLTGPPGTGKSMTARWVAELLGRPLLVLNLATIMSHELGRSANNLSTALDAAASSKCVLFIDEFDAVASHRGNTNDVGEMRRMVNVLLLRLDRWSEGNLLLAATNHPELLDKAVNRRFEVSVQLPLPDAGSRENIINGVIPSLPAEDVRVLAAITDGHSGSALTTSALRAARHAALDDRQPHLRDLLREMTRNSKLPKSTRDQLVRRFNDQQMSSREIAELIGISHVTVRNIVNGATPTQ